MGLVAWLLAPWRKPAPDTLGARGERRAAEHLRKQLGMKILATNVRCPGGELDIVALDGPDLVFVEVRTRATDFFGTPESTIDAAKRRFLTRSARWFIQRRKLRQFRVRFDTVAIVWPDGQEPTIRHRRNAFAI